jgi:enoyl-CoA hydratase
MTSDLCEGLHATLRSIAVDRSCRVVILTGAGRGFCAGLDLRGYGRRRGKTVATRRVIGSATSSTCRR